MNRKKILILGKLPPPYMGPAIATQIILNSSLKKRYELIHLNTKANNSLTTMGKWSISKIFINLKLYFWMLGLIFKHRPSIVLIPVSQTTSGFIKDFFFIAVAKITFRKIIIHLRGSNFLKWFNSTGVFSRFFIRQSLRSTAGVIVLGNKLKYLFAGIYPEKKIFVVPNGGDYIFPEKKYSSPVTKLLYLATLMEEKGITDVFSAAVLLKKNGVEFEMDVVGDWLNNSTRDLCLNLVEEYKLPVRIHSSKNKTEKLSFLSAADIFIFPPRSPEGHPWVIVEAMAASLPIISTDQGAITESVIDNENGFIILPAAPEILGEKIKILIENQYMRKEMGIKSRKLYLEKFTEEKMVENLSNVFETVINNNH